MKRKLHIEFDVEIPEEISQADALEWAEFELRANGQIKKSNPLSNTELNPKRGTFKMEFESVFHPCPSVAEKP